MRYCFEDFALDTDRRELRRGADVVPTTPQVFDLLAYLIRNREQVVSKDDLVSEIWMGRIVSDAALTTRLNAARSVIGDTGEEQRLIKTLPRKGVRFVGAVHEADGSSGTAAVSDSVVEPSKPVLPDKPSIAVLPFQNMSGDPEQEYFADGMVEEIITVLSRFKWLFVIARNSSFTFKDKAVDIKDVGRSLGVRYIVEGSVRKASGRVRIAAQLIDAVTGAHIWADRFERDLTDVFALQDEVALAVVSAIQPKLLKTEIAIATRRRPENLTAYDLFLRAMPHSCLTTGEELDTAIGLARRALELDPRFGSAAVMAGACHMKKVIWDHSADPQFDRREALRLRQLALSVDDDDSETLAWAAMISTYMIVDRESEIEMADRAVALNPNSFHAWHCKGWVYLEAGLQEEAIACFEHAMRVSPIDPLMYSLFTGVGVALLELHRFDEAIVTTKKGLRQNTSFAAAYRCLASAYAHLGQSAEAREAAAHVLETDPGFTISGWIARGGKTHVPLLIEGLRKAGLPE